MEAQGTNMEYKDKTNNKSIFRTRYRIVADSYCGYEVQVRYWWFPIWIQDRINTHSSIEKAKKHIDNKTFKPIEYP